MVLCQAEPPSRVSTNSKLWDDQTNFTAWEPFKFLIKDGVFYSKDISILKAKLSHWDYWFSPHPFKNRFEGVLLDEFQKRQDLVFELDALEKKHLKYKKRTRLLIALSGTAAFTLGLLIKHP